MSTLHPDQDFQRFLATGRLMLQRSISSGRYVFPPRIAEPGSGSRDLEWIEASGDGTVYSLTIVAQRQPAEDYNVALIDLAEGPRLLSRLDGLAGLGPESLLGAAVRVKIVMENDQPTLLFRLTTLPDAALDTASPAAAPHL